MTDISIIIVNYNVKFFLEQCILSIKKASGNLSIEIIVVDNHSVDGSVQMLKEKFHDVILIENKDNVGFAKANNQGIKIAKGKYVLLLNPDTVLQEDTLEKCFEFMNSHLDAGALGVKMFDGKGNFLPESKRGLPTPSVAFFKIFGLSKIFPQSKLFGKYHLTYLSKDKNHSVDVLSGAFMFIRKSILDTIGGLDEDYFMYGEDIDLSYRVTKSGYKNYYLAETQIIHYKGESTKKSSVNYVIVFYKAMEIFASKHFSKGNAKIFNLLIYLAIYLRAGLSIAYRFLKKLFLPLIDTTLIALLLFAISGWYEVTYKNTEGYFDRPLLAAGLTLYALVIVLNTLIQGGYEKNPKLKNIIQGVISGFLVVLCIYALLPEDLRFSRAIILSGGIFSMVYFLFSRYLFYLFGLKNISFISSVVPLNILIVGDSEEFERIKNILNNNKVLYNYLGLVTNLETQTHHQNYSGNLNDMEEVIKIEKIDEIIFCSKQLKAEEIINCMTKLSYLPVHYKIAPPNELYIIGSNDIDNQGELYSLEFKSILLPENIRKKRGVDVLLCLLLMPFLLIITFFYKNKSKILVNWWQVLIGRKTWIGFGKLASNDLPKIKSSIIFIGLAKGFNERSEKAKELSLIYAKDYKPINDIIAFFKLIKHIDG